MIQTATFALKNDENNHNLFINIVFSFFPISLILGSFVVNLNVVLFVCLGIYYLKKNFFTTKLNFCIKIAFIFFFVLFFSTGLSLAKSIYFEGLESIDVPGCFVCYSQLERFTKSFLFFRFFLLLMTAYLLGQHGILRFKYFFLTAAFSSVILSLDIIYQYFFNFDLLGYESVTTIFDAPTFQWSGFFGDENVAGGYLLRFGFFSIFFTFLLFKNKTYTQFFLTVFVICILGAGILFSGNKMPLILFIFGLLILFLSHIKIKKIILVSLLILSVLLKFIVLSNEAYKIHLINQYSSLIESVENTFFTPFDISIFGGGGIQKRTETERVEPESLNQKSIFYTVKIKSNYLMLYMTAFDTWKFNKILGNGLKSFREDCGNLEEDINLTESQYPDKKNRLCSTHPHNYYFEILTETGIVGLIIILIIAYLFIASILKNWKFVKKNNTENFILLAATISFALETLPLKTTGSLFTTNNSIYIVLIASILLNYKNILKIKT